MIVRKLTRLQKSNVAYFNRILEINNLSYSGIQSPKASILLNAYNQGDVYITYNDSRILAGFVDDIVGFAIVIDYMDNFEPLLWSIAVHPSYRGQGFATSMLMEVEKDSRALGARTIRLTVHLDNPAQKLYFDAGYRVVNVARNHYLNEGDGLVMKKILK